MTGRRVLSRGDEVGEMVKFEEPEIEVDVDEVRLHFVHRLGQLGQIRAPPTLPDPADVLLRHRVERLDMAVGEHDRLDLLAEVLDDVPRVLGDAAA